ncbi:MAG: 1-acyl-sn-glycerol-3-phosphate acyltransferase (EC [uncultured Sulfurovum sp.]|uniref:1-acyl-sn-glycerol-3-phosphate acyltransferase n=1 Tax=uncultured Sulfurovum sp. TaxID=269237 RepID=A0A6S6TH17_9BACT|nr:MAG: 1-acyl-sn-glycerol-3-phosphate acyltransferase (EC [uncultured Sulfurovum sp.]
MTFNTIKQSIYALYLTNSFGFKLKRVSNSLEKKALRTKYSEVQLKALNIKVKVLNREKIPEDGQYLVICNHRGIIDPPVLEVALKNTNIFGVWVSKKELYNSPFFGLFVRNAGSILLDREKSQMSGFFSDTKKAVKEGSSIFIFPEGTRNKTEESLIEFKEGFRIIALKNRLPILPVYIRSNTNKALGSALENKNLKQTLEIEFGGLIDYKERGNIQTIYKKMFAI